jgi:class 3 adenylate cyclase
VSWNKQKSKERIEKIDAGIPPIEVSPLQRKMDLNNVTLGKPKMVEGVHLYVAVANEAAHVTDLLDPTDRDAAQAPLRAVHLWQREVGRIVCTDFDAAKVHFQGTRLHAIVYRPVGDSDEIITRAVALAHAIEMTTRLAFNEVLGDEAGFKVASGASFGDTLATRSGSRGDSELLFLGNAANHGAKAIKSDVRLRVTPEIAETIVAYVDDAETTDDGDGYYRVKLGRDAVESIVERYKLGWSLDQSRKRIEADLSNTPLDKVGVSKATANIDKDRLSLANSKLNDAASLFGDVDGFTATVEAATTDVEKEDLIRRFHVIRAELRHVTVQDFDTLRVQYQGDRIQALRHMPHDDEADRALRAVRLAAAWQSSMEETLPSVLVGLADVHLAVGLDVGATIVSRLGERGNRDVICLGKPVRRAAKIQGKLDGDEVGISDGVRKLLPGRVADLFTWDSSKNCYVAQGLRYNDVILAEEAEKLDSSNGSNGSNEKTSIPTGGGSIREFAPRPRWHR